jgi:hypothetical protein
VIHYHGTPITPLADFEQMAGRCFCVSYARPEQVRQAHQIGQSVMLDNGAYTFWRQNVATSPTWWDRYWEWAEPWLDYQSSWAVLPDVIDGTEEENDFLLSRFCRQFGVQGAPVWHMHESLDRLYRLTLGYSRVCIGSSGTYADPKSPAWRHRMDEAFNRLCPTGKTPVPIHMLRAMQQACEGAWPFASADSTNIAQNHNNPQRGGRQNVAALATRLDAQQPPARWEFRAQIELEAA